MRAALRRLRADESGFTLVELLTVMLVSTVVMIALFTFQDITLRQSNAVFAKVDATQRARNAVEGIENRLRSACMAEDVVPIQAGSTDTSLAFVTKYGSAATLLPEKHVISLNTTTDVLTDTVSTATGGSVNNWTYAAPVTRTMLDHVEQVGTTPVFRYYKYGIAADSAGNQYLDAAGNPFMILLDGTATLPTGTTTSSGGNVPAGTLPYNSANDRSRLVTPLSAADAKLASAVTITMSVGAGGGLGTNTKIQNAPVAVQDSVVLRLTPVPSEGNLPTVPPCA